MQIFNCNCFVGFHCVDIMSSVGCKGSTSVFVLKIAFHLVNFGKYFLVGLRCANTTTGFIAHFSFCAVRTLLGILETIVLVVRHFWIGRPLQDNVCRNAAKHRATKNIAGKYLLFSKLLPSYGRWVGAQLNCIIYS